MKIYFYDINELTDSQINHGYDMLDSVKKTRVDNCNNTERRKMIIASDILTRTMLSRYLNVKPDAISFAHSSHGKPVLPNGKAQFNVSHSGDYWVGCVDDAPCGIDIEVIRDVTLNSSKRFCTPEEMEYIITHKNQSVALLEIWTRKEAYFKSIGCGIATVLTSINVLNQEKLTTRVFDEYVISLYGDRKIDNFEIVKL